VRVTREKLIQLARKEVERRASLDGGLLSGYIIGSVAAGDPLLGETGDIDLVLIHDGEPEAEREVIPLSDEIHIDVHHHPRRFYAQPPQLRVHPWLGPALCEPIFLYDPTHFFERAQAGARGQFHRPDHVRARAAAFLDGARRLHSALAPGGRWMAGYLAAVRDAANAAGTLAGFPAAGRRVALALQALSDDLGHPEVYGGFLRLLGAEDLSPAEAGPWLSSLARAYDVVATDNPSPMLAAARRGYYLAGFQALVNGGEPHAAIWPMLEVWESCLHSLGEAPRAIPLRAEWHAARERLGLAEGQAQSRTDQLESYIDHVETVIEEWAERHGA
jgi:hypothetical protein